MCFLFKTSNNFCHEKSTWFSQFFALILLKVFWKVCLSYRPVTGWTGTVWLCKILLIKQHISRVIKVLNSTCFLLFQSLLLKITFCNWNYLFQELFCHHDTVMKIATQSCDVINNAIRVLLGHSLVNKTILQR